MNDKQAVECAVRGNSLGDAEAHHIIDADGKLAKSALPEDEFLEAEAAGRVDVTLDLTLPAGTRYYKVFRLIQSALTAEGITLNRTRIRGSEAP